MEHIRAARFEKKAQAELESRFDSVVNGIGGGADGAYVDSAVQDSVRASRNAWYGTG